MNRALRRAVRRSVHHGPIGVGDALLLLEMAGGPAEEQQARELLAQAIERDPKVLGLVATDAEVAERLAELGLTLTPGGAPAAA